MSIAPSPPRSPNPLLTAALAIALALAGAGCGSAVESAADGSTPGAPAVPGGTAEVLGADDLARPAQTAEPLHPVTKPIVDLEALPAARR
jgi:hypothetical protein